MLRFLVLCIFFPEGTCAQGLPGGESGDCGRQTKLGASAGRRFCLLNMETSHDQEIKVSSGPQALGLFSLR